MAPPKKVSSVPAATAPVEVVGSAEGVPPVGAPAPVEALPVVALPVVAAALKPEPAIAEPEPVAPDVPLFPRQVMLRNNGGFAVAEPVSGAFLQAGGSQSVWLHDEAHASRVLDNLHALAKRAGLSGLLLIDDAPLGN